MEILALAAFVFYLWRSKQQAVAPNTPNPTRRVPLDTVAAIAEFFANADTVAGSIVPGSTPGDRPGFTNPNPGKQPSYSP